MGCCAAGGGIPALPNAHPLDLGSILAMSSTQPSSTSSNPVTTQADSMLANLQNNNSGMVCFHQLSVDSINMPTGHFLADVVVHVRTSLYNL